MKLNASLAIVLGLLTGMVHAETELVIGTVSNRQMVEMRRLSKVFEAANPDIKLTWITLDESVLRRRVTHDIVTKGGQFDIMTIGFYETPIWGKKGWLAEIKPPANYHVDDLLPAVRNGLSVDGKLYAVPFYGESSMLMYRKDLADKVGIRVKGRPTWPEIKELASKIHDPAKGIYGICLRGKAGWGENMAILSTMINTFGGQWFDMSWKPQIDSKPWHEAISFYVDLLKKYGPPNPSANGYLESLNLFAGGKCGIWVDATISGAAISDPKFSKVSDKFALAQAPTMVTPKGANWLWAWSLAIPAHSQKIKAATKFVTWATSRDYIDLVGNETGWGNVPTGTRKSTYANPEFLKVAKFAANEMVAINTANPTDSTLPKSPYVGVQFAAIPEFQEIGDNTGEEISEALAGLKTIDDALKAGQAMADREMIKAGYYKK